MRAPRPVHLARLLTIAAVTLAVPFANPAYARPEPVPPTARPAPAPAPGTVWSVTDGLARQLAAALRDRSVADRIRSVVTAGPVDPLAVGLGPAVTGAVRDANLRVLAAKGLPRDAGSLLRLRLAHPDMRPALARGELPLVAATPTDDITTEIAAYQSTGATVSLDPARVPSRPVLLVEVDTARALPLGLRLIRAELASRGIRDTATTTPRARTGAATAGGYWATKITAVRLADDHEPWLKGDAEIYGIVAGFGLDGKATVGLVQMPYLDTDGTTYYPNQLLVHFNGYKYNLADVVMMEDDGDTNYQQLVQAIVGALLTIVDGGVYTPLVNAILAAIPTSWYTDDPDYVDSWYTLSTGSAGRVNGASGNGWFDLTPHFVQEL